MKSRPTSNCELASYTLSLQCSRRHTGQRQHRRLCPQWGLSVDIYLKKRRNWPPCWSAYKTRYSEKNCNVIKKWAKCSLMLWNNTVPRNITRPRLLFNYQSVIRGLVTPWAVILAKPGYKRLREISKLRSKIFRLHREGKWVEAEYQPQKRFWNNLSYRKRV